MSTTETSLEQRLDALESRNAVADLIANYNRSVDSHDEDLWMSVWHEDAEYLIGDSFGDHIGADAIKAILHGLRDYFPEIHHYATNVVISVDGDHANAKVDSTVTATDKADRALMLAASYVDEFERRDGTWGFTKRDVDLHFATPVDEPWTMDRRFVLDA